MDLLLIPIIMLPLISQLYITSTYKKYSNIRNNASITGKEAARKILDMNGLNDVEIITINGTLSDHYDPRSKKVALSNDIANKSSIAAISVAAHECGHAIQDKEGYFFLKFRSFLVPIVNFTSKFAMIFIFIGLIAEIANLFTIGIILISAGLLFQLITLPVEYNASFRAKNQLISVGLIAQNDISNTKSMLNAAALTYVASLLASILQVARLLLIRNNN